jgi:hypothetical protein
MVFTPKLRVIPKIVPWEYQPDAAVKFFKSRVVCAYLILTEFHHSGIDSTVSRFPAIRMARSTAAARLAGSARPSPAIS